MTFRATSVLRAACLLALMGVRVEALAQPAPDQMCGNGTTFTVNLPGTSLGIDDSQGIFQSIDVPDVGPADSITLPNGCNIYAFLVAGYSQNADFNDIIFYKLAEYVAQHNGYVHMSWWNNLLHPYMGGPLHPRTITIKRLFGLLDPLVIPTGPDNPLTVTKIGSFLPGAIDLPKANPDEDFQFQSDAALVIKAIRQHNPTAIIVVAGHSMGGASVVRLGLDKTLEIDLLAPIDAGNNRDKPLGVIGTPTANRSRWRSAVHWRGYKQWDCVRNSLGLCQDFDDRLFVFQGRCTTFGPFLPVPPVLASRPNIGCVRLFPYVDPGVPNVFGNNIKHLYHRWQHEFGPPSDFLQSYPILHVQPPSTNILGRNYQKGFPASTTPFDANYGPNATCRSGLDPRDPSWLCRPEDGHGEIIGHRGFAGEEKPGLAMRSWPTTKEGRRAKMIELRTADESWPHRPENPDLCLVCDDMIAIVQHLLDSAPTPPPPIDATAPLAIATATPSPNAAGWNNDDVVLQISGVDEPQGSGVKEIETILTGAQTASVVTPGAEVQQTVSAEGTTTLSYFARDNAGNAGAAATLSVKIDKTAPQILGNTDGAPNAHGWFNRNVTVSFTASDEPAGSGLASVSPSVVVTFESSNQEVTGTAQDAADNEATSVVTLSIDKTAPVIALSSRTVANAFGWNNSDVTVSWNCSDGLSGAVSPGVARTLSVEGANQQAIGTCADFADNTSSASVAGINLDKTPPSIAIVSPSDGSVYLLNAPAAANYGCADALSGIATCAGSTANGAALDTATVGGKSLVIAATDVAGNGATAAHGYAVRYAFSGFVSPVAAAPLVTVAKAGRTVPLKYALHDANGAVIADLATFRSLSSRPIACDGSGEGGVVEESDAPGSTSITFADGQFHYNWKTDTSWVGCRVLELILSDGATHQAKFQFK